MDRRIDERFRKPRRTKGTPFFVQRKYWAAGTLGVAGLIWFLLESTPGVAKAKKWMLENSDTPEAYKSRVEQINASWGDPVRHTLLAKARAREAYKNEPKSDSLFVNYAINLDKKSPDQQMPDKDARED